MVSPCDQNLVGRMRQHDSRASTEEALSFAMSRLFRESHEGEGSGERLAGRNIECDNSGRGSSYSFLVYPQVVAAKEGQ